MGISTDLNLSPDKGKVVGPGYIALKERLRWRIRRARKTQQERARFQSPVKTGRG